MAAAERRKLAIPLLCAAILSGYGGWSATAATPVAPDGATAHTIMHEYTDSRWGFRIAVPVGWRTSHGFPDTYLANGAWKTYARQGDHGEAIIALTMPGSNDVADAEIRIGASRDPAAIRDCAKPPSAVRRGSVAAVRIDGTTFTTFVAEDAAMSHHLEVHSWRTVHAGACFAIDRLVYGTNPAVYDPPATPPFTARDAFRSMRAVLNTFRFIQR